MPVLQAVDLDLEHGLWTNDNNQRGSACARPMISRGAVWVGDAGGRVARLSIADGAEESSKMVKGIVRSLGASRDQLLVGTLEGTLYPLAW